MAAPITEARKRQIIESIGGLPHYFHDCHAAALRRADND